MQRNRNELKARSENLSELQLRGRPKRLRYSYLLLSNIQILVVSENYFLSPSLPSCGTKSRVKNSKLEKIDQCPEMSGERSSFKMSNNGFSCSSLILQPPHTILSNEVYSSCSPTVHNHLG